VVLAQALHVAQNTRRPSTTLPGCTSWSGAGSTNARDIGGRSPDPMGLDHAGQSGFKINTGKMVQVITRQ
jgi:hypothetical protein